MLFMSLPFCILRRVKSLLFMISLLWLGLNKNSTQISDHVQTAELIRYMGMLDLLALAWTVNEMLILLGVYLVK